MSPVPPQTFLMATSTPLWRLRWHSVSPGERWLSKTSNKARPARLLLGARLLQRLFRSRLAPQSLMRVGSLFRVGGKSSVSGIQARVGDDDSTGDKRRLLGCCRFGSHAKH